MFVAVDPNMIVGLVHGERLDIGERGQFQFRTAIHRGNLEDAAVGIHPQHPRSMIGGAGSNDEQRNQNTKIQRSAGATSKRT